MLLLTTFHMPIACPVWDKMWQNEKNLLPEDQPHSTQFDLTHVMIFETYLSKGHTSIDIHLHYDWKLYTDWARRNIRPAGETRNFTVRPKSYLWKYNQMLVVYRSKHHIQNFVLSEPFITDVNCRQIKFVQE